MQEKKIYRIGISGHRDLKKERTAEYRMVLIRILVALYETAKSKGKTLRVVSPLADGADRLMVYTAKKLGIDYEVFLPMDQELYEKDFDDASLAESRTLLKGAEKIAVAPLCEGCNETNITDYGVWRDQQYQTMGFALVDSVELMVFMWDGDETVKVGGTYDILSYAKQRGKPMEVISVLREG